MATFEVLGRFEGDGGELEFTCERCGQDGLVPTKGYCRVEHVKGMTFVYDPVTPPPDGFLPARVKCRYCHMEYSMGEEPSNVR